MTLIREPPRLRAHCQYPDHEGGDIGSGTGISSELFLRQGCTVFGVEPNDAMRTEAERRLERHERFHSIAGSAEQTTLPVGSVDVIATGQAFHWFDVSAARSEFLRILRAARWAAVFWNERKIDGSTFMLGYEALVQANATTNAGAGIDLCGTVWGGM